MELMQELQKARGRPACRPLPIAALGAHMQRAKQGGTLALPWGRHFDVLALAKPAALDVGFIGKMGCVDTEDFYRPLDLADADAGDNFCHPDFFSALGALRGTGLAKRLYTQPPVCNWRRTVASLTASWCWARESRRRSTVQPSAIYPQWLGRWAKRRSSCSVTRCPVVAGRPDWGVLYSPGRPSARYGLQPGANGVLVAV